jgi:hypothetical protein
VSASSYSAGVPRRHRRSGRVPDRGLRPRTIAFPTTAGVTYYLIAIDDQSDGGGNGGTLSLTVDAAPPPPDGRRHRQPDRRVQPKAGSATISGTMTCSGVIDFALVQAELHQAVGRGEVAGLRRHGRPVRRHRPAVVAGDLPAGTGTKFSGGKAASVTFAVACGPLQCSVDFQEHQVKLTGRG